MEFEFKENRRNISDNEFIDDIKRVSKKLNSEELTTTQYNAYGKYNSSTIYRRFGSWNKALEKSGIILKKEQRYQISKNEIIEDIKLTTQKLNVKTISSSKYIKNGKYSLKPIMRLFGSWSNALNECGLNQTGYNHNISNLDLFKDIEQMWIKKGSQPTTSDVRKGLSSYSLNTFCRRFGGWNNTIKAFQNYINSPNIKDEDEVKILDNNDKQNSNQNLYNKRKTSRNINLRLRFKILKRDNFKCCICGASPAKNTNIELHVDHIIPYSKGGETIEENLQTLCSNCNLGKSDLI